MKIFDALRRALQLVKVRAGNALQASGQRAEGDDDLDSFSTGQADCFFKCNSCLVDIPQGTTRYHCEECEDSYDLCAKCFSAVDFEPSTGQQNGKQHADIMGSAHLFQVETRSPQKTYAAVRAGKTLQDLLLNMFMHYADRKCLGVRDSSTGKYTWNRYRDLQTIVQSVAAGLDAVECGGDVIAGRGAAAGTGMVALCGSASAHWYTAQLACTLLGKPTVPIVTTADEAIILFILTQTEVKVLFCTKSTIGRFENVLRRHPELQLRTLILLDEEGKAEPLSNLERVRLVSWTELVDRGLSEPAIQLERISPSPDSIYTVMYTSGSTGAPKGCTFTRKLYDKSLRRVRPTWLKNCGRDVWFSFQPPAHSTDHRMVIATLVNGGCVGFYRGDMQYVFEDVAAVSPMVIACTPRFWTMLYNQYQQQVMAATLRARERQRQRQQAAGTESATSKNPAAPVSSTSANLSLDVAAQAPGSDPKPLAELNLPAPPSGAQPQTAREPALLSPATVGGFSTGESFTREAEVGAEEDEHRKLAMGLRRQLSADDDKASVVDESSPDVDEAAIRRSVSERFSKVLGHRAVALVTGGAATGPAVLKFMRDVFSCMVMDGYGATEVGAITQDGRVTFDATVKLVDVPELGYLGTDDPPRGEICVKTANMISGYYQNEEETKKKFVGGYFRTGDIGVMDPQTKKVKIIDRMKNIFKLSQGEFVAPERLETILVDGSAYICQVYVYGQSEQDKVVAVVVPEKQALCNWWQKSGEGKPDESHGPIDVEDYRNICSSSTVYDFLWREIESLADVAKLPGWEIPCRLLIEPELFSPENGLLTETTKPCRPKLQLHYRDRLRRLYDEYNVQQQRSLADQVSSLIFAITGEGAMAAAEAAANSGSSLAAKVVDSLEAAQLSAQLLESFDVDLPASLLVSMRPEHIVQHVQALKARGTSEDAGIAVPLPKTARQQALHEIDWEQECALDKSIQLEWNPSDVSGLAADDSFHVLLTGAGGFLGGHILRGLLSEFRNCRVTCVMRGSADGGHAVAKCRDAVLQRLASLQPSLESADAERIHVLPGDLGLPRLGLSHEDFDQLSQSTDLIIHNGAEVSSAKSYQALRAVNVGSTVDLLRMLCRGRPKRMHFVSSVGIFGGQPSDPEFTENDCTPANRLPVLSGYSQTKHVCEKLLATAVARRRCPVSVSRPGLVGPDCMTGDSNHRDWLYWLLRGVVELQSAPAGDGCDLKSIDVVNVDYVAAAIVTISTLLTTAGCCELPVYHLVPDSSEKACTWKTIVQYLRTFGYSIKDMDYASFRQAVLELGSRPGAQVYRHSVEQVANRAGGSAALSLQLLLPASGGLSYSHRYSSNKTRAAVQAAGLSKTPARPTEEYYHTYFARLVADAALASADGMPLIGLGVDA